jgi:hypothetical protein
MSTSGIADIDARVTADNNFSQNNDSLVRRRRVDSTNGERQIITERSVGSVFPNIRSSACPQVNEGLATAFYGSCSPGFAKTKDVFLMSQATTIPTRTHAGASIIAAIALLATLSGTAVADDLLGLYFGGSVGQSHDRQVNWISLGRFPQIHRPPQSPS